MKVELTFPVEPKAIQSFRFTRKGIRYQPKDVIRWKEVIGLYAKNQLGAYNLPLFDRNVPLKIDICYMFAPLKSFKKAYKEHIREGGYIHRVTKPDLDNLGKGLIDALSGIVWEGDQQIVESRTRKVFTDDFGIVLSVESVELLI